ncbi:MAG: hypothetical protein JW987_05915 [Anaerolineaceae bacterium]|nr:hypothetical protein [Anaerolineaceae bacterium]
MKNNHLTFERLAIVALTALVIIALVQAPRAAQAAPSAAAAQMLGVSVFNVSCVSIPTVTSIYTKLTNLGTFSVNSVDSVMELTFNGRIAVDSIYSGNGAVFELRVDNVPSGVGRARASMRTSEAGSAGVQVSLTGLFTGLSAGNHTASLWVRTSDGGSASGARVDPGCWSSDVLIVKEYLPFGLAFLPTVINSD